MTAMRNRILVASVAALAMWCAPLAHAADFPTKAITIIVPFAAGGPTDTVARLLGQAMGADLKQTVVVENVAGAGGTVGAGRVARADPDGYTLFLHHIGQSTAPALYRKLPYNAVDDFAPIGLMADIPNLFAVNAESPYRSVADVVRAAKAKPGEIAYGSAGNATPAHLVCELM